MNPATPAPAAWPAHLPRVLLLVLVALAVGTAATAGLALAGGGRGSPSVRAESSSALVAPRPEVVAAALLEEWDVRRAVAWERGDLGALAELYTPTSAAGRADRAMLRAWRDRGLRVLDLRMQVIALRVVTRSERRLVLEVTDRLASGTVVAARAGGTVASLPRDGASTRTIELRRAPATGGGAGGPWRVAAVAAGAAGAGVRPGPVS